MSHTRFRSLLGFMAGVLLVPGSGFGADPAATSSPAAAAKTFLASLDDAKRSKVQFAFDDTKQRKRWSNLPTGIYERTGLKLGDLDASQRKAALQLLAVTLSKEGYEKVIGIMEGDEAIKGTASGKIIFGRDEFYIAFLGTPSPSTPWEIQFGGHHLALNITLVGEKGTLAPSHTAAQPAKFTLEGRTIRPLGQETDLSFKLINALSAEQQEQAILGAKYRDLVLGPGHDGEMIAPEGVKVSGFTKEQRRMLLQLVEQWVGILNPVAAKPKMTEIEGGLDATYFAWSGPIEPGSAAYFRIQGPAVFIEYAPQALGGDPTQHIHTMFRDPTNEYGSQWVKP